MSYMSKKSFHPGSRANRNRVELSKMNELIVQRKFEAREKELILILKSSLGNREREAEWSPFFSHREKKDEKTSSFLGESKDIKDLDEEDHPERKVPDTIENKRVRDFLKSQPLTGHGAAFGKTIYVVQCYRCKCYGHRAGDSECKYTETGDIALEMQRRIREDPLTCFKRINDDKTESTTKVQRIMDLLEEAKKEKEETSHKHKQSHHHRHKKVHHHKKEENGSWERKHYSSSSSSPSRSCSDSIKLFFCFKMKRRL